MRSSLLLVSLLALVSACAAPHLLSHAAPAKAALTDREIDQIAELEMLEDRRAYDPDALTRLLRADHPEVRRRAAQSVGRIADKRGVGLLQSQPLDRDTSIAATTVWAVGQLRDTSTVGWFEALLVAPATMPTVATEAAIALGKIKTARARDVLARYLTQTIATERTRATLAEAFYSFGRATTRGDLAPVTKWLTSSDDELRYRATWVLARTRDPAGVRMLLAGSRDRSALIRSWALRGLTRAAAESASLGSEAQQQLLLSTNDPDRRVRTEAIRSLASYNNPDALAALLSALRAPDSWLSVSAAEGLGTTKSSAATAPLREAASPGHPCALRITAMQALQKYAVPDAIAAALTLVRDTIPYCRTAAVQLLRSSANTLPVTITPGMRTSVQAVLADTTLVPRPQPRPATAAVLQRPLEEYRALVRRWIVPAYNGAVPPLIRWETPQGVIDLELAPGDAPLAVEEFMRLMSAGSLPGTQFTRVVPDFVDQQETIRGANRLRDEVNRRGLTRGNLAWATAGLDTGRPGYTLNHTPQPHNEGDFTSMGRVVAGQDVVDRIELGDRILSARVLRGSKP